MIVTNNPKAVLYNDRSVLENHHLSSSWTVLCKEESNFLCNITRDELRLVREQVVDMVMSTDLTGHFAVLSAFRNKVLVSGTFNIDNKDDRSVFWRVVIKSADVSNLTKEWRIYEGWLNRIMEEFFRQGDEEKRLNLPVSPFMDRATVSIPNVQLSFIDFICLPMFEAFMRVTGTREVLETLMENRERLIEWRDSASAEKITP
jgi:hypothetical protein